MAERKIRKIKFRHRENEVGKDGVKSIEHVMTQSNGNIYFLFKYEDGKERYFCVEDGDHLEIYYY